MSLYYLLMALSLAAASPFLLLSAKRRDGFLQKLGFVPRELCAEIIKLSGSPDRPAIWFHAVSVGEFSGALPLVREFAARNPQYHIFVSTTTATGQALAKQRLEQLPRATVFYFPFDLPFASAAWLNLIKPEAVVIVETEIWPGFTWECKKRGIKLAMINARMSPRSFRRYTAARAVFAPVIRRFDLVAAQSQEESKRFLQLCGPVEVPKIEATGNLKYDRQVPLPALEVAQLRKQLQLADTDKVIVAGSTHEGEEAALLKAYRRLLEIQAPYAMRLILVPRHPERWENVCRLVESHGFKARRYSRGEAFNSPTDVYVLDTIGQLTRYYAIATAAFVGGTMVPIGGHNLVEPYVYGVPVVCGNHLFKTRDVARQLEELGALTVVHNGEQLETALAQLLQDSMLRQKRAEAGNNWLKHSEGAIAHTLELLESVLK